MSWLEALPSLHFIRPQWLWALLLLPPLRREDVSCGGVGAKAVIGVRGCSVVGSSGRRAVALMLLLTASLREMDSKPEANGLS